MKNISFYSLSITHQYELPLKIQCRIAEHAFPFYINNFISLRRIFTDHLILPKTSFNL